MICGLSCLRACLTLISLCSYQTRTINLFLGAVLLVATPHLHQATRRLRISIRQLTAKMTAIVHEDLSSYLLIGAWCSAYVGTKGGLSSRLSTDSMYTQGIVQVKPGAVAM